MLQHAHSCPASPREENRMAGEASSGTGSAGCTGRGLIPRPQRHSPLFPIIGLPAPAMLEEPLLGVDGLSSLPGSDAMVAGVGPEFPGLGVFAQVNGQDILEDRLLH